MRRRHKDGAEGSQYVDLRVDNMRSRAEGSQYVDLRVDNMRSRLTMRVLMSELQ